jgi:hypothetical protein
MIADRCYLNNNIFGIILFIVLKRFEALAHARVHGDRERRISGSKYPSEERPSMTQRVGMRTNTGDAAGPVKEALKTKYVDEVFVKPAPAGG